MEKHKRERQQQDKRREARVKLNAEIVRKLHPSRFSHMSGKMAAIVGCILGEVYTNPYFAELCITSDGMVLGRHNDDCGMNEIIGAVSDLERNWQALLDAGDLTPTEKQQAQDFFQQSVTDWRR